MQWIKKRNQIQSTKNLLTCPMLRAKGHIILSTDMNSCKRSCYQKSTEKMACVFDRTKTLFVSNSIHE